MQDICKICMKDDLRLLVNRLCKVNKPQKMLVSGWLAGHKIIRLYALRRAACNHSNNTEASHVNG